MMIILVAVGMKLNGGDGKIDPSHRDQIKKCVWRGDCVERLRKCEKEGQCSFFDGLDLADILFLRAECAKKEDFYNRAPSLLEILAMPDIPYFPLADRPEESYNCFGLSAASTDREKQERLESVAARLQQLTRPPLSLVQAVLLKKNTQAQAILEAESNELDSEIERQERKLFARRNK